MLTEARGEGVDGCGTRSSGTASFLEERGRPRGAAPARTCSARSSRSPRRAPPAPAAPGRATTRAAPAARRRRRRELDPLTAVREIIERVFELGDDERRPRSLTSAPRASARRRRPRDAGLRSRTFSQCDRRRGAPQGREPAAHGLVQDPRRVQPARSRSTRSARRGVVASSAGNHAQGVALAAAMLGIRRDDLHADGRADGQGRGDAAVRRGDRARRRQLRRRPGRGASAYASERRDLHLAFDDERAIAGPGHARPRAARPAARRRHRRRPARRRRPAAGIATADQGAAARLRVVGVQAQGARRSPVARHDGFTIADGIAVKRPGELTFRSSSDVLDDVVSVTRRGDLPGHRAPARAGQAARRGRRRGLARGPAGRSRSAGAARSALLLSGGNLDATLLAAVVRHGLTVNGRYMVVRTRILDRPGSLLKLLGLLAQDRINLSRSSTTARGWYVAVTDVRAHRRDARRRPSLPLLDAMQRWG